MCIGIEIEISKRQHIGEIDVFVMMLTQPCAFPVKLGFSRTVGHIEGD